ncbi:adenosylcobalamin-dependent ribonucleoside-diphosphate reductase [Candidatus Pacearchaeota archaeon]|nr:adenosylcobalamin-dependent ribonucleoside-diphosphate reductase [Candidatus Pacearchaeota archaeon]
MEQLTAAPLTFDRYFTEKGRTADSYFNFAKRDIEILGTNNQVIYSNKGIEFPEDWSDLASRVVSNKYAYKGNGDDHAEKSLKSIVYRVAETVSEQGVRQGLIDESQQGNFTEELAYLNINQMQAFNSPVWFNVGLYSKYGVSEHSNGHSSHWALGANGQITNNIDAYENPQCAACFIQSIDDSMESILEHAKKEGMLFKFGSGTGTNFSTLRGINEPLSGGGIASGMGSFMRIYDIIAGRIQSGGKTRRAAKMVICDCDHPDIYRFINWKVEEEKKALWLSANPAWGPQGPGDLESEAYKTVDGQNGNNSVRVTDEFMIAAEEGKEWDLWFRTADKAGEEKEIPLEEYQDDRYLPDKRFLERVTNKRKTVHASQLLNQISRAATVTGDPALQYDTAINKWNTCPNSGRINGSNPCSEFMFLDDSACNLASLNLTKFSDDERLIDTEKLKKAIKTSIISQELLVDYGSYPSEDIAKNSHNFRPLGLGYTNLGALLMERGIAYDSDEGRSIASAITSFITGYAYKVSAEISSKVGPFAEFEKNKEAMLNVLGMHHSEAKAIKRAQGVRGLENLIDEADKEWSEALKIGTEHGYRNAQTTLLAPTGTIGFMMDVDCTGIEPMIALKSTKGLAGGGELQRDVAGCVEKGLAALGYRDNKLEGILDYINDRGSIIGAPGLQEEHYEVFSTAFGDNTINVDGHLKMMAAVQPHLSGAISKTVNLPKGSSIEEVKDTYVKGWKLGLKSISLYIDGSKGIQPVNVMSKDRRNQVLNWGTRDKPSNPIERFGWNIDIGNAGVHVMIGEYSNRPPSGSFADAFVSFGRSGSKYSAIYDTWAKEASRNRQRGEPTEEFIKHNLGASGSINGMVNHPHIKTCSSIEDFVAKYVALNYLGDTTVCNVEPTENEMENLRCNVLARRRRMEHFESRIKFIDNVMRQGEISKIKPLYEDKVENGKIPLGEEFCISCGHETELSGASCRKCTNCGDSEGCG